MKLLTGTGRLELLNTCHLIPAIEDSIEQELESPMRLGPEQNLRSEHEELARANICINYRGAVLQVPLAPGPAAAQGMIAVEPGYGSHAFQNSVSAQFK